MSCEQPKKPRPSQKRLLSREEVIAAYDQDAAGARLKFLRDYKGYSQEVLAQMLGCLQSAYSQWETGGSLIPVPYAIKLDTLISPGAFDFVYREDLSRLSPSLVTLWISEKSERGGG